VRSATAALGITALRFPVLWKRVCALGHRDVGLDADFLAREEGGQKRSRH
jgi:hypothetical protein